MFVHSDASKGFACTPFNAVSFGMFQAGIRALMKRAKDERTWIGLAPVDLLGAARALRRGDGCGWTVFKSSLSNKAITAAAYCRSGLVVKIRKTHGRRANGPKSHSALRLGDAAAIAVLFAIFAHDELGIGMPPPNLGTIASVTR
jgi:uncharacterized protein GlcG (DUF336 family)